MSVNSKMTAIANAIRAKTGSSAKLSLDGMAAAIAGITTGGGDVDLPVFLTEINFGTFKYGATTSAVDVAHGLGGKPSGFAVWRGDLQSNPGASYINSAYGHSHKYFNPSTGGTFYGTTWILNGGGGTSTGNFNADTSVFRLYTPSMKPSIQGNTTYYWIAWRE